jgi:hypothetical protein
LPQTFFNKPTQTQSGEQQAEHRFHDSVLPDLISQLLVTTPNNIEVASIS